MLGALLWQVLIQSEGLRQVLWTCSIFVFSRATARAFCSAASIHHQRRSVPVSTVDSVVARLGTITNTVIL